MRRDTGARIAIALSFVAAALATLATSAPPTFQRRATTGDIASTVPNEGLDLAVVVHVTEGLCAHFEQGWVSLYDARCLNDAGVVSRGARLALPTAGESKPASETGCVLASVAFDRSEGCDFAVRIHFDGPAAVVAWRLDASVSGGGDDPGGGVAIEGP